jgi:hypothetical protein
METQFTCAFPIEGESKIFKGDVIEHQKQFWLVPAWLESPDGKYMRPTAIIPLVRFQHQDMTSETQFGRFAVNEPMPKELFADRIPAEIAKRFGVVLTPDLEFEKPKTH